MLLGLTFLIRVDLGIFFSALWLGASALSALHRGLRARGRVALLLLAPVVLLAMVAVCHVPFYLHARQHGYDAEFAGQYRLWPKMLASELRQLTRHTAPPSPPLAGALTPSAPSRDILRRKSWRDIFSAPRREDRLLAALLYLPLLSLVPLALCALVKWIRALRSTSQEAPRALAALLAIGGAFTVFPQYFFFRPDAPHLSEFSPPFWAAVAAAPLLLSIRGWGARVLSVLLALHAAVFLWRMWPDRWAGTIWVRKGRTHLFEAENGVRVLLGKRDAQSLAAMRDSIRAHSQPQDYLVAYPYHPAINLLANRPTYERDVYADNATRSEHWDEEAIARIERFQPAVIVLSDWAVNGHDQSRFSVWAAATRAWIEEHYESQGIFPVSSDRFELYSRPAKP